jgi:hypothetical protein
VREQQNEEDVEKEGGGFHHRHRLEREREKIFAITKNSEEKSVVAK